MNMNNNISSGRQEYETVDERPVSNGMSNIEHIVMKRVRRIHILRRFINRTTIKAYSTAGLLAVLLSTVSVANVYANMPSVLSPGNFISFIYHAALNTEVLVQITLVSIVFVLFLTVRDIVRNMQGSKMFFAGI